jgi:ribonuclease P protein component
MMPPNADVEGQHAEVTSESAALSCLTTLQVRRDFLKAAAAKRQAGPGFLLQARARLDDEGVSGIRVGYTCSKKIGNSVIRNRAKRRLREVARKILPLCGKDGWDYVLVGRPKATITRDFDALLLDLQSVLVAIHSKRPARS